MANVLPSDVVERVVACTGATALRASELVQTLWDGYGGLWRVQLAGGCAPSVMVKEVRPRAREGRASSASHARKCKSYEVEVAFYAHHAARTNPRCRVPRALLATATGDGFLLVLEDLAAAGYPARAGRGGAHLPACVRWLAAFHAAFLGAEPNGVWPKGSYWHLDTRADELARTAERELVEAAPALARALDGARFRTWVHGDAKPANACLAQSGDEAAFVDFQYVGGGPGVVDLAYLLHGDVGQRDERALLGLYFRTLRAELAPNEGLDLDALEREWRALYVVARADFVRFLAGWAPGSVGPGDREVVREARRLVP